MKNDPALAVQARRRMHEELTVALKSDYTLVVGSEEKTCLEEHAGGIDARVIPTIHSVQPLSKPFQERTGILFIGGFDHRPNVDAVEYFTGSIFSGLRRTLPGLKFYVVGSNPPDEIRRLACSDIIVTGYQADVSHYFRDCRLSVAPNRFGAGVKGKVTMSLAYGLPTVVTPIAAEGLHLVDGENSLIADDPPAFAAAIERLYRSEPLWLELSQNGRNTIEKHFFVEAVARELDRLIDDAGLGHSSHGLHARGRGFSPNHLERIRL